MRRVSARKPKKRRGKESGQAVLEFALILPLLVLLLMGVLDFGWLFMNQYRVEKAASDAARYGAIHEERYENAATRPDFLSKLKDKAADNLPDNLSDNLPEGEENAIHCVDVTRSSPPESCAEGVTLVCVDVDSAGRKVSVTVTCPVRTLTFVASTVFGKFFQASATSVSTF